VAAFAVALFTAIAFIILGVNLPPLLSHPGSKVKRVVAERPRRLARHASVWSRAQRIYASWRDAGFPVSLQDRFIFATSTRHAVPG
jgi:hypothetical protein